MTTSIFKEEVFMKKNTMVKRLGQGIGKLAVSVAKMEANSACPYISYQPQKPEAVKKLRKF